MKFKVELIGSGIYSSSKPLGSGLEKRNDNEDWTAHGLRTWKEHLHKNSQGYVAVSLFGLKAMLDSTAQFLGKKIEGGGGKRTYTKLFQAGVVFLGENPTLYVCDEPVKIENVPDEWIEWVLCSSEGKKGGGGAKVLRPYPNITNWSCEFEVEVLDKRITKKVFIEHIVAAGQFNGIGRSRPQNGGIHGRFTVIVDGIDYSSADVVAPESEDEEEDEPKAKKSKKQDESLLEAVV